MLPPLLLRVLPHPLSCVQQQLLWDGGSLVMPLAIHAPAKRLVVHPRCLLLMVHVMLAWAVAPVPVLMPACVPSGAAPRTELPHAASAGSAAGWTGRLTAPPRIAPAHVDGERATLFLHALKTCCTMLHTPLHKPCHIRMHGAAWPDDQVAPLVQPCRAPTSAYGSPLLPGSILMVKISPAASNISASSAQLMSPGGRFFTTTMNRQPHSCKHNIGERGAPIVHDLAPK